MSSGSDDGLVFVCVATGDYHGLAELYLERLFGMLRRFSPRPFRLVCITDRPRKVAPAIQMLDCSGWDEFHGESEPTLPKLGLFNPAYMPFEEFFFLDLSLIIRSNLSPILDYAAEQTADLVIVKDWFGDCHNSSVMRIRPAGMRFVYDDYINGLRSDPENPGDQHHVTASVRRHGVPVSLFPDEYIVSLKKLLRDGLVDSGKARTAYRDSIIVKFHGRPKMHQFFDPKARFFKYGIKYLSKGKVGYPIQVSELKSCWIGDESH